jgi:putative transposase
MPTVIDEFTRGCLAIDTARQLKSDDVLERLPDLFVRRGVPGHIRSGNGPEFTAEAVREWLGKVGVTTLYIGIRPANLSITHNSAAQFEA